MRARAFRFPTVSCPPHQARPSIEHSSEDRQLALFTYIRSFCDLHHTAAHNHCSVAASSGSHLLDSNQTHGKDPRKSWPNNIMNIMFLMRAALIILLKMTFCPSVASDQHALLQSCDEIPLGESVATESDSREVIGDINCAEPRVSIDR